MNIMQNDEENKDNVLFTSDEYIIKNNNSVEIEYNSTKYYILPYKTLPVNIIKEIGCVNKDNKILPITGFSKEDDCTDLDSVIRILYEQSGYNIVDITKWKKISFLKTDDLIKSNSICYIVDISVFPEIENENLNNFKMLSLNEIFKTNNVYLLSLLLKIYCLFYR